MSHSVARCSFAGFREVTRRGGSSTIALPREGLRREGIDPEQLEDRSVYVEVKDQKVIVHLDPD